jgi:hypothetical protein
MKVAAPNTIVGTQYRIHIFEQNLLTAAIVKLVVRLLAWPDDSLSDLKRSSVFQKIGGACRPKGMGRECIPQPGVFQRT